MSDSLIRLSITKISQEIDLNKIIGKDISKNEKLVLKIGQAIIDYMNERVSNGMGVDRVKLKSPYSKSYSKSLDFIAAGKSKSDVNMSLSGDMMASIDIIKIDGGKVTIGIEAEDQAVKAYGHQTGFKGHPVLGKKFRRPFFGVTENEVKKFIISDFTSEISARKTTSAVEENKMANEIKSKKTLASLLDFGDE